MKVLDSLKRTLESLEATRCRKTEGEEEFAALFEKHNDIPREKLMEIINDFKAMQHVDEPAVEAEETPVEGENEEVVTEDENKVDVTGSTQDVTGDAGHTDANKEDKERIAELDASEEDGTADQTPIDFYTEEDEEEVCPVCGKEQDECNATVTEEDNADDELILSEEDEETENEEIIEEDEEDFDVYKDELDVIEGDEEAENEEPMIEEDGEEEIDDELIMEETEDNIDDELIMEESAHKNEANIGAKAAIANKYDGKKAFSSDVDALTEYLDEY